VYIDFRYPTDQGLLPAGEPSASDRDYAVRIARKLKKWIEENIKKHY